MQKKTAMQQLIDYMRANFHLTESTEMEFTDSLEAEKEQIKDAYNQGYRDGQQDLPDKLNSNDISKYEDAENYFTKTYKKD